MENESFVEIIKSEYPEDRLSYAGNTPVFHPQTAEEAARLFRLANRHRQRLAVVGSGSNGVLNVSGAEVLLVKTARLNRIELIAPQDFYVTVGAGFLLRELNRHLADDNLYLPHSALDYRGTVGGAIAVGLTAETNGRELPLKKYFIKGEIVTPEGDIITPGSICFKSVSGYDIVKIFYNSWGLLGLIASATFRVMPKAAEAEHRSMTLKPVSREHFLAGLDESNTSTDAVYSRKIKAKFDPNNVLPIV
jgi:glycolate oxidase